MKILGVRVDEADRKEAETAVGQLIAAFRRGEGSCSQVVTINPEGVWLAKSDPELKQIIADAALVTADGSGILWAAEKLGTPLRERVTGIDLLERLCELAAAEGWRVFLLGAVEGVAKAAGEELCRRYPGLIIAGVDNGYFRDREGEVLGEIAAAKADILFAALGMPFQEKWLHANRDKLNCGVMMGVGGSFDVISGLVRRAPRWMQKLRLEWLWRLLSDPKRWRRYLVIPAFMSAVKKESREKS